MPGRETTPSAAAYRAEIDGLRAIAVVAVIVNHLAGSLLPGGYLGVDVFFVISGFVITASMAGRPSASFGEMVTSFYARRVKRLVPALVLYAIVASFLICVFNPGPGVSLRTGIAALFGGSNVFLLWLRADYFATAADVNVFTHTWSLGVEEQFYVLFPALLWRTGYGRGQRTGPAWMLGALLALSVLSLGAFVQLSLGDPQAAFYLMPARFWELATGCALFVFLREYGARFDVLERFSPALPLLGVVAVLFVPARFGFPATIAIVVLTAAAIALLWLRPVPYRPLVHPAIVYVGLISYSLYLWHWGVLSLSRWTIGVRPRSVPFQIVAMVALAAASYHLVERPLRRAEWTPSSRRTIGYGLGATVAASLLIVLLFLGRTGLYAGRKYLGPSPHEANEIHGTSVTQESCMLAGGRCFTDEDFERCLLPGAAGRPAVFFVGSSHAMHLAGLGQRLHAEGLSVAFLATEGKSFMPLARPSGDGFGFERREDEAIHAILRTRTKPGDVVVVGNRYRQEDFERVYEAAYYTGMDAFARALGARGVHVVHVLPLPEYAFHDVNQCAPQWFNAGMIRSGICLPVDPKERERQSRTIEKRFPRSPFLRHFDPALVLCPSGLETCTPFDEKAGLPTFRNGDHLSNHGASLLGDSFLAFLREDLRV